MAIHCCPQCSYPLEHGEIQDGACPACRTRLAAPPAPAPEAPALLSAEPPRSGRVVPFLLGLLLGAAAGAAGVWAAWAPNVLPPVGAERAPTFQDQQAQSEQAEQRAREAESDRQQAESRRADAAKALDAANARLAAAQKERDEAEGRARDALTRLAEGQKPKLTPTSSFVRDWQLIGPFPTATGQAHGAAFPPEREPVQLDKAYDGYDGKVRWRPYHGADDKVNLSEFFNYVYAGDAYAVSWVHSDEDRDVTLGVGSDDGVVVWVNREKVHDFEGGRPASPGQDTAKARLKKGWNEVLAKVDNIGGDWALYLEFRTAGGEPLKVFSTSDPPPTAPK